MERARTLEQKNIHPVYNDREKLERGINELEKRLHTQSISRAEENSIIKEIKQVKESDVYFQKIDDINEKIKDLRKQRSEVHADLSPIIKIANQIKDKISKVKEEDKVFFSISILNEISIEEKLSNI